MSIAEQYVTGLKKAYYQNGGAKQWDAFEKVAHGAAPERVAALRAAYPDVPDTLIRLLEIVDGTYWREYEGNKVAFYFLGSDVEEYPYYLLSAAQMLQKEDLDWLSGYVDGDYADMVERDERITDQSAKMCWLHFSDCMNNGGTSQLFIDFSPSPQGKKGQIVRYLHDPDEIAVIADDFDAYLQMLMEYGYDFITEDTVEE